MNIIDETALQNHRIQRDFLDQKIKRVGSGIVRIENKAKQDS